jgi:hypothetical protein
LPPPTVTIDHLALAAVTLADGIDYIASLTGVVARPGGKHATMGTHNALLRLGSRLYLEIIAIDPDAAKPPRPRWFGMDGIALQSDLTEHPRLIHWVARTDDIERAAALSSVELGPVHSMSRGDYRWRMTIPDDGHLPGRGLVPTLIQWDVPMHPADGLPHSGLTLTQLAGTHPDPAPVRKALDELGVAESIHVTYDRNLRLAAMLRTPKGTVTLSS